jgi:hypothetical protein
MEEPVDDVTEEPFKEPEEIVEDPIIQGISFLLLCSSIITQFIVSSHILFLYYRVAHSFRQVEGADVPHSLGAYRFRLASPRASSCTLLF